MKNLNEDVSIKNYNYIKSFDGFRTIAVILVMLYHIIPHIVSGGYLGVVIFLVLSGYLVTDNFFSEMDKNLHLDILKFWKKRVIKLYKPLIPMLIVVSLIILFFFNDMLIGYVGNLFSSLFGFNNIYQIMKGFSYFESHGNPNPFTHLWSLGLEVQFYIIWPIFISLCYKTFKLKRKTIAIIIFILSIISASIMCYLYNPNEDVSRIYYGIDTRAFSFLIGSLFACLYPREKIQSLEFESKKLKYYSNTVSILMFLLIVYISVILDPKMDIVYRFGMYTYSILVGYFLIFILIKDNIVNKFLSNKIFTSIGRRTYSLYLWQYPISIFITTLLKWHSMSIINLVLLELSFSIIFAELSYRLFESKDYYSVYENSKENKNISYIILLSVFIVLSTSVLSLSKKSGYIDELQQKLENIEKNNEENNDSTESKNQINKTSDNHENKIDREENIKDISNAKITFIGDSVMLSSSDNIKKEFKNSVIDAKVSRQYWDLPNVLENLKNKNGINDIVVIHLGTNYKINKQKFKSYLDTLENRKIFLINCVVPESWEGQVNSTLNEISNEMENVKIIDWFSLSKNKKELFYKDATHPNEKGAKEYTDLIKTELSKYINN